MPCKSKQISSFQIIPNSLNLSYLSLHSHARSLGGQHILHLCLSLTTNTPLHFLCQTKIYYYMLWLHSSSTTTQTDCCCWKQNLGVVGGRAPPPYDRTVRRRPLYCIVCERVRILSLRIRDDALLRESSQYM